MVKGKRSSGRKGLDFDHHLMACIRDQSYVGVLIGLLIMCLPEMPAALLHLCHMMAIRAQWWISLHPLWRNFEHLSPKFGEASPVFQGKKGLLEYPQIYIPPHPNLRQLDGHIWTFAFGWPMAFLRVGWHCPCFLEGRQRDKMMQKFPSKEWVPECLGNGSFMSYEVVVDLCWFVLLYGKKLVLAFQLQRPQSKFRRGNWQLSLGVFLDELPSRTALTEAQCLGWTSRRAGQ